VFQKPYNIKHQYILFGVRLTKLKEEEKEKIIENLEEAIRALERLSISVGEKAKEIENDG
jgi:hypothetical protein